LEYHRAQGTSSEPLSTPEAIESRIVGNSLFIFDSRCPAAYFGELRLICGNLPYHILSILRADLICEIDIPLCSFWLPLCTTQSAALLDICPSRLQSDDSCFSQSTATFRESQSMLCKASLAMDTQETVCTAMMKPCTNPFPRPLPVVRFRCFRPISKSSSLLATKHPEAVPSALPNRPLSASISYAPLYGWLQ
jgi:hypothetical protein